MHKIYQLNKGHFVPSLFLCDYHLSSSWKDAEQQKPKEKGAIQKAEMASLKEQKCLHCMTKEKYMVWCLLKDDK
jgi:hypothetical protein